MSPVALSILFVANLLTLAFSLSVLMLALWQYPGNAMGRALIQFLAAVSFLNLSILLSQAGVVIAYSPLMAAFLANFTAAAFGLCVFSAFSLVVAAAGMMKQAFQVLARAGFVIFILLQWPLWTNMLFTYKQYIAEHTIYTIDSYTDAGKVAAVAILIYSVMAVVLAIRYRQRIGHPTILASTILLLAAQTLTIFSMVLRELGILSIVGTIASAILGYSLVRMQLFNPLIIQTAQLDALRNISEALANQASISEVLQAVAHQAHHLIRADFALIFVRVNGDMLEISAQDGGTTSLVGRQLPIGHGLSGRVFERRQPLRLENYRNWEGRSPVFADLNIYASLSVPLIYNNQIVGVLTVAELDTGRNYNDRDQAILEMLAPQAAVAIVNTQLRQQLDAITGRDQAVTNAPQF